MGMLQFFSIKAAEIFRDVYMISLSSYGSFHTPIWLHLSSPTLVWCSLFSQAVVSVCKWCLGLGTDLHPWELLLQCESSMVQVFTGDWTLRSIQGPRVSAWKVDPQWSLLHLYELHHHSDCVLKYGSVAVLTLKFNMKLALPPAFTWLFPQPLSLFLFFSSHLCSFRQNLGTHLNLRSLF